MKGRIFLVIPRLSQGGAERVAVLLANSFLRHGYEIILFVACGSEPGPIALLEAVKVVRAKKTRFMLAVPSLCMEIRRYKPTIVISFMTYANCISFIACKMSFVKTRIFFTEHSNIRLLCRNLRFKGALLRLMASVLYGRADKIIAVSQGVAGDLQSFLRLKKEPTVIYNPTDVGRVISIAGRKDYLDEYKDEKIILAVGRLVAAKDYPTLLRAFSKVRKMGVRLVIAGDGPERSTLEQLSSSLQLGDRVDFVGQVDDPYPLFARANVFVLSSAWEGFGNVLVEALAWNLPIVSTDCDFGPSEILEAGRWGALVPVRDDAALGRALEEALEVDAPVDTLSRALDFDEKNIIPQYLKLLDNAHF